MGLGFLEYAWSGFLFSQLDYNIHDHFVLKQNLTQLIIP